MFKFFKKTAPDSQTNRFAEAYFQEQQMLEMRKSMITRREEQNPLQVMIYWVLIPIFLASLSTSAIIVLSMLLE